MNRGSHAVACNGFSQVFSSRQKGGISPKIYPFFTSPMAIADFWTNKYRLDSLFGIQLFFVPFWGELSAAAFCYGAWFIVLVLVLVLG